ncbi:MAG: hypothetical protein OXD39_04670 [Gemmatimonadetes bacterium]|nr:hypothetical protein [Gemmatimonadota bacterium]
MAMTTGEDRIMAKKTNDDTLLAHLAWMLSSRHEDVAVEALGYILKSASARRVVKDLVNGGGADTGEIVSVLTQVGGEEGTRPDLVGYDRSGNESLIIEAKFWAGLTSNQPNAYLRRLKAVEVDKDKALLFVAPGSRVETLWAELRHRAGTEWPVRILTSTTFKSVRIGGEESDRILIMSTSWSDLLNRMENAGDADMLDEIRQLKGFVNRIDESGFPPLYPEELAPAFPRRLNGLRRLIDDATARSVEEGCTTIDGLKAVPRYYGYGRYIRIANTGTWFGIDTNRWGRGFYPDSPLWLIFEQWIENKAVPIDRTREALRPMRQKDPPECFDEGSAVLVPIPLPTEVEYDKVLDAVAERIRAVSELIRNSAGGDINR